MERCIRSAALPGAFALIVCSLLGCSSATTQRSAKNPGRDAKPATSAPAAPQTTEAQQNASEHFYRGKALALAGDTDCARIEFDAALESFRQRARPGDDSDLRFADQLYESVKLYRSVTESRPEKERPPAENPRDSLVARAPASSPEEVATAKREVEVSLEKTPDAFDIPVVVNDRVLRAVAFYQFRTPQLFAGALQRSGRYLPLMRQILKEQGVPQDLVYVAMVESAFKSGAHSRKAAHGYWQFIEDTGRRYGLRKTRDYDERSDPVKSTLAAARYFKDLYEMFGDWHLAMAGYDAGEGRIIRGLQRTGARDYWELAAGSSLHQETRDYVPFVLAAALISKNPARYGFDVVPDAPLAYEVVRVPRPVDLARIAAAAGTTLEELQLLNGELKTRVTPRGFADYPLRVPPGASAALTTRLASLPAAPEIQERQVRARRGDTLARIAARYGVSVNELAEWNDLPRGAKLKKGAVVVLATRPTPSRRSQQTSASAPTVLAEAATSAEPRPTRGEIRALPTPASAITSAAQIGSVPSLPQPSAASVLPARIDIPAEGFERTPPRSARRAVDTAATKQIVHTVKTGETLFRIALKYGLSVDAIRKENRLGRRSSIAVGRRLTLTLASIR